MNYRKLIREIDEILTPGMAPDEVNLNPGEYKETFADEVDHAFSRIKHFKYSRLASKNPNILMFEIQNGGGRDTLVTKNRYMIKLYKAYNVVRVHRLRLGDENGRYELLFKFNYNSLNFRTLERNIIMDLISTS